MASKHIAYLEMKMKRISNLPIAFEYYSAIHLTKVYKKPFHVYKDVTPLKKVYHGFPIEDKGVDVIDEDFQHIGQVKYYLSQYKIHYGTLATFLATPILVNKKLQLTLLRTNRSLIHSDVQQIIARGHLQDIRLCGEEFLESR